MGKVSRTPYSISPRYRMRSPGIPQATCGLTSMREGLVGATSVSGGFADGSDAVGDSVLSSNWLRASENTGEIVATKR